jgi:hypothetical protein
VNPFIEFALLVVVSLLDPVVDVGYILIGYLISTWMVRAIAGLAWFALCEVGLATINQGSHFDGLLTAAHFTDGLIIVGIVGSLRDRSKAKDSENQKAQRDTNPDAQ